MTNQIDTDAEIIGRVLPHNAVYKEIEIIASVVVSLYLFFVGTVEITVGVVFTVACKLKRHVFVGCEFIVYILSFLGNNSRYGSTQLNR